MPLKLDLKNGEKMIVNGAVLENVGANSQLLIHNQAAILREKEILTKNDAATPASRVYYELQCAYIFPESRSEHIKRFGQLLLDYASACPSASSIADSIREYVDNDELYKGLKETRKLIGHEVRTLDQFNDGMSKLAQISEEFGAPASDDNANVS